MFPAYPETAVSTVVRTSEINNRKPVPGQNRNHRDHNEQFDQRETGPGSGLKMARPWDTPFL